MPVTPALNFPVYLIGPAPWLKSKLDDKEYLFVFTSADVARQFIPTCITRGAISLVVAEMNKAEFVAAAEEMVRVWITWIVVDYRTPSETRWPIAPLLAELKGTPT